TACDDLYTNRTNPAWDYFDKKDALASCLTTWSDGDGKLFSTDINMTPRFAWLPILAESNLTTEPSSCPSSAAAKCVHFNDFVPVYMQTLYTLITGGSSAGACDDPLRTGVAGPQPRWGRHDAGEPINCGNNNGNLDRLSSFVLDCAMLPDEICDARPGTHPGGDVDPILELTK
ncbi:MAG TPA: hypothetical protein VEB69_08220, partial [Acidimicrobiia bacterium]|nr:hypothetical protein [Acidimicrobiia bacterium]